MLRRIEHLYNELIEILDNAPDESDCCPEEEEMFADMANLTNSIRNAGYANFPTEDMIFQTFYCPLSLCRNVVSITDPRKIAEYALDIRDGLEQYKYRYPCDLTEYLSASFHTLKKIYSIGISIRYGLDGGLYGAIIVSLIAPLTPEEESDLKDYITGQLSDGWGESFEQHDIGSLGGLDESMYLSFWRHDDWWLLNEEEFEQKLAENRRNENKDEFPW